jgi:hypothetical protein
MKMPMMSSVDDEAMMFANAWDVAEQRASAEVNN